MTHLLTQMALSAHDHITRRHGIFLALLMAIARPGFGELATTAMTVLMAVAEACIIVIYFVALWKGSLDD